MLVLVVLTLGLVAFTHKRNANRKVKEVQINFEAGANLFVTAESVDKLLIQNGKPIEGQYKEILDLKDLEDILY